MCPIDATHGALRCDEATPPRLHNHGIWPAHRRRGLRSEAVFRFAQQLLHEVDPFVRDAGTRGEAEGLFPVQDLLPSDVPLRSETARGHSQENAYTGVVKREERGDVERQRAHDEVGGLTELLTNGGKLRMPFLVACTTRR